MFNIDEQRVRFFREEVVASRGIGFLVVFLGDDVDEFGDSVV